MSYPGTRSVPAVDVESAARLVAHGMRPKALPARDPAYADLVRRYLAYFLVARTDGAPSPTHDTIRSIVPDNRRGVYDMRRVITALADVDSVFELRPNWAKAAITSLVRATPESSMTSTETRFAWGVAPV